MIIRIVYYNINSSKTLIDLVDFFNNYDKSVSKGGYHVIDGALKRKDGQFFGKLNQKNILMNISIRSEEAFQKLQAEKILNPEFLVPHEEIDSDEFSNELDEVFKKGKFFENEYFLFKDLEVISFKFEDNSIPLSTDLLDNWYIPIRSNNDFKNLTDFYKKNTKDILDMWYIIIDEEIKCKDGRVLGEKSRISVCLLYITKSRSPFKRMVGEGLIKEEDVFRAINFNEDYLKIDYFIWNFKKSKEFFNSVKKLADYLKDVDFKFEDNTILNI